MIVDNLDKALNKTPNYKGNIVRVMQMNNPNDFINQLNIGGTYTTNQYLSFSNKEGYNPNANIKIYISNSTKGKNLTKINKIGENEVLYQRNKEFRTLNITEKMVLYMYFGRNYNELGRKTKNDIKRTTRFKKSWKSESNKRR